MNKKLVALAVGSAFAFPLAAQAQTANVTLYGRLNLDLEFVNGRTCQNGITTGAGSVGTQTGTFQSGGNAGNGASTNTNGVACSSASNATTPNSISNPTTNRVSSNSSRFGMRGTESLGGGLNAVFQIESNVSGDTGNSSGSGIASRETFVGLQGSWGRAIMGSFLMPQDDLTPIFGNAPTLGTSILNQSGVWAFGNQNVYNGGFDQRIPNSIRYDSPNLYGFTAAIQYATLDNSGASMTSGAAGGSGGNNATNMIHANIIGGNAIYSNGPFQAGASFEVHNKVRNAVTIGGPNLQDWDWTVTGSYNFGTLFQGFGLQVALVYEQTHYDVQSTLPGSGCFLGSDHGTCSLTRNMGGGSVTIPLGGGKLFGLYEKGTNGRGSAPDGTSVGYLTRGGSTSAQQWEVSYSYNLSPRTMLYAGYVKILNECKASYTYNINPYAIAVGQFGAAPGSAGDFCSGSPGGAIFGMVHLF